MDRGYRNRLVEGRSGAPGGFLLDGRLTKPVSFHYSVTATLLPGHQGEAACPTRLPVAGTGSPVLGSGCAGSAATWRPVANPGPSDKARRISLEPTLSMN